MQWDTPAGLDAEVRALCIAMNHLPGIQTTESCSGHGREPFRIWFDALDLGSGFATLARCTCPRYYPFDGTIQLYHGDVTPVQFLLEMPIGAFEQADRLAENLMDHVLDRMKGFNILLQR